jgi:hypothetical protein
MLMHVLYSVAAAYGVMTVLMMLGMFYDHEGSPLGRRLLRTLAIGVIWPYFIASEVWYWWDARRWKKQRDHERMLQYQEATAAGMHPAVPQKADLKWDPLYCPIDGPCGARPMRGKTSLEDTIHYEEMWHGMYEDAEKDGHCGNGGPCRCLASSRERVIGLRLRIKKGETTL